MKGKGDGGQLYWETIFQHPTHGQKKLRLGPAHVAKRSKPLTKEEADEAWARRYRRRRGRPPEGHLKYEDALHEKRKRIAEFFADDETGNRSGGKVTFRQVTQDWLATNVSSWSATTARNYRAICREADRQPRRRGRKSRGWRTSHFGGVAVGEITSAEIRRFLRGLDRGGLTPRTINVYRGVLHSVLEHAREEDLIAENPCAGVAKRRERQDSDLIVYSLEEVGAISRACINEQDGAAIMPAALTGLRKGELTALKWRHVEFDSKLIRVQSSRSGDMEEGSTKSGKVRVVPMSDQAAELLAQISTNSDHTKTSDYVLIGRGGGPLNGAGTSSTLPPCA